MVTQTVVLASHPQQYGGILQLCDADDVVIQSAPAVETRDGSAVYTAVFTDAPAATYRVKHLDAAGTLVWTSAAVLTLTTATFTAHDSAWLNVSTTGLALEATAQSAKTAAESADGKLTAGRLSRIDRLPDVNAGAAGGLSLVGSEMTLSSAVLAALFSDTDTAALVNSIIARIESDLDGADVSVAAIATAVRNAILDRILAGNHDTAGTPGKLLQTASTATALATAQSDITAIKTVTAKLDTGLVADGGVWQCTVNMLELAPVGGGGGGGTDWTADERAQIRYRLGLNGTATAPTPVVPDPIVVTPGTGNTTTAYLTTLSAALAAQAGVEVQQELLSLGRTDAGLVYDGAAARSFTSSGVGLVEMPSVKGATYRFSRGGSDAGSIVVTIPLDAGATYQLPSLIGR